MGKIGNFGKLIVFEVSEDKILTFSSMQRTVSANWGSHERIGKKPLSEFLSPNLQTVTLEVTLSAQHGVKPRDTLEAIASAVESGKVANLVIGKKKVGEHKWKITQSSETWDTLLTRGELYKASVSLTFEEYL
ncbi:MAG: phage tail protein [Clostridia bacterium]|nr:phage tail protein [Clostridia bacterium]